MSDALLTSLPFACSFFDEQKGDFSLDIESVTAIASTDTTQVTLGPEASVTGDHGDEDDWDPAREKADVVTRQPPPSASRGWWRRILCGLM